MKFLCIAIAFLAARCVSFPTTDSQNQKVITETQDTFDIIREKLSKAKIINEVLDDFRPKCFVAPVYGKKGLVALGNSFKKSDTEKKPSLKIVCPNVVSTPGLTIALTDPDAPSRNNPKWSEMCHWVAIVSAVNSTATGIEFELTDSSLKEVVKYKAPGPPPKTGYHRYVFVLLEGDNSNLTAPADRQHWGTGKQRHGVRDWAKNESLEVIGANWFVEKNKKQKKSSLFLW